MKPREHGAWALLYGPVLVTLAAFGTPDWRWVPWLIALTSLFLAEAPLVKLVRQKSLPVMESRLRLWRNWLLLYLVLAWLAGVLLVAYYHLWLLLVLAPVAAAFLRLHLFFVSRRRERDLISQLAAVVGLTAGAPATYYVLRQSLDPAAGWIWLLNILFFSSGIFYVRMRISRLTGKEVKASRFQCFSYHLLLLLAVLFLYWQAKIPSVALLAFVPVLLRGFWGTFRLAPPASLKALGYAEVGYTLGFVALLALGLRMS